MSKTQSRELSLSEVIDESNLVVEVEFIERFEEEVPVINRDSKNTSQEAVPPFLKKGYIFKIKKVLKNSGDIKVPEKINVPDEDWRRALSQHKEKYTKSPAKSHAVMRYSPDVKSITKAFILFLHHFQGMYELTAKNAFESKAAQEKISMLISNA
jgi:uncharacterized protein (UPF0335 family)